jgi:DNA-binding LytR/AlgR family response regulator
MKEFLILGNTRELYHIDSADIWYVSADGDYSDIFLTNGKRIPVTMQIGEVKKTIDKFLPQHHNDFKRIGRSLIINKIYLFNINLTEQKLVLSDKQNMNGKVLESSKDSLKEIKNELEKK